MGRLLKPVVARYQGKVSRTYFWADAAFAMPGVYEFLEAERIKYAIRLLANRVLQDRIGYLFIHASHLGFQAIKQIAIFHGSSGFIRRISVYLLKLGDVT
jgi:hypothetical protein